MKPDYEANSKIIKAIADSNRLKIIDILSCGEKCACDILEYFDFTQPTLSHHMKVLMECGLVKCRKEGLWSYYSLNFTNTNKLILFLMNLTTDTDKCICKEKNSNKCLNIKENR
ncbi:metalloregulator ArsR/SmtB family transcription factor [Clostridium sp. Ade.TY]|uniref:ArsR/SmtB family transcription factor n=1 Tax=Clostridium sp. Ade.TY TaxID=1391647 RepID=UPI000412D557|nr:metalloregulator ArsR/SmtB family transcription factor [Clostridium sp. Ade.TY]